MIRLDLTREANWLFLRCPITQPLKQGCSYRAQNKKRDFTHIIIPILWHKNFGATPRTGESTSPMSTGSTYRDSLSFPPPLFVPTVYVYVSNTYIINRIFTLSLVQ
jgi:hypothetical protein